MRQRANDDSGQAVVEFALTLPVLVIALLGVVQIVVVVRAQLAVTHAAREGARAASVAASPADAASQAARRAVDLEAISVGTTATRDRVTVVVRAQVATDVPLVGALFSDVTVTAGATMARET